MWIQVRSMDGKSSARIDGLSKLTKIEDLRKHLIEPFGVSTKLQRLFYRGKQLEDGYTLFDYNVGLNDIIQLLIKSSEPISPCKLEEIRENPVCVPSISNPSSNSLSKENNSCTPKNENESNIRSEAENGIHSKYFEIGDFIDAKDNHYGAWFEAKLTNILTPDSNVRQEKQSPLDDCLQYDVTFESYQEEGSHIFPISHIRLRARKILKFEEVKVGDTVMVNYNVEEPKERGYWYDCNVTGKRNTRTVKELIGTVFIGVENVCLKNCHIKFTDEIFAIEEKMPLSNRNNDGVEENNIVERKTMNAAQCTYCKDIATRKCKHCSCHVCGGKDEPSKQILCDECDLPYHIWCLDPPLDDIPSCDEWYCPLCKNDENEVVKAGQNLKKSKKKEKMASSTSSTTRDWGKGMACVGRTKECTLVAPNHFGPIPGIEVGMTWKFRVQVSESGVHRPHVAGIHGRENEGAYSIVLSGGYEDDHDEGEEFTYTGSGGRDLSGNKRTAEQSCDQLLTRMNKALALNCASKLDKNGTKEAKNWMEGKPVRVIRSYKGRKHSIYCPEEGNRYDGIYKVIKYWPEKGKSGFVVWRYLLRRDDSTPAPWTKKGQKRMKELGLEIQYPEGYLESKAENGTKRKEENGTDQLSDDDDTPKQSRKKIKVASGASYKIPDDLKQRIKSDKMNAKIWEECKKSSDKGLVIFLKEVETNFLCICCQDLVVEPITTQCLHNICKACLVRSFKAEVYSCPLCRRDLGKNYEMKVNNSLAETLESLFPGYTAGR